MNVSSLTLFWVVLAWYILLSPFLSICLLGWVLRLALGWPYSLLECLYLIPASWKCRLCEAVVIPWVTGFLPLMSESWVGSGLLAVACPSTGCYRHLSQWTGGWEHCLKQILKIWSAFWQHAAGSWVLMHSDIVCIFLDTYRPLACKVIICIFEILGVIIPAFVPYLILMLVRWLLSLVVFPLGIP